MRPRTLLLVTALASAARTAAADDPTFAYGKPDDAKVDPKVAAPVEWTATAEAGLVLITGTTESTTLGGGIHASRKAGNNKLSLDGTAAYQRSGVRGLSDKNGNGLIDGPNELVEIDTTAAETLLGKLRYDRFVDEHESLYVAALGARDLPAGKAYGVGGQVGYSRRLTKTKTSETVAELGYDYSSEKLVGDPEPPAVSIHSLRAFVGYKGEMTTGTTLETSLEALSNLNRETLPTMQDGGAFQDTRVNGRLAVSAKLGKGLAVQTSIEAHFDNRPGPLQVKNLAPGFVPAAEKLDTIMKFNLIYTLF